MKVVKKISKKSLRLDKKSLILLLVFVLQFAFPQISAAQAIEKYDENVLINEINGIEWPACLNAGECLNRSFLVPTKETREPKRVIYVIVTAYSSTLEQTDATPCITASGLNVCERNRENIIAANFLPIGTKIRFPEYFGNKIFTVQDRMNPRYYYRADVWMKSREAAKEFGVKKLKIEIY